MKTKTAVLLLYTFFSLALLFLILWLVDFSRFDIPEFIPGVQLRTYGILILISFILVFIFLQKSLLRLHPNASALKLTAISSAVSFISLFIYQSVRQLVILRDQYSYDISSVFISTVIPTIVLIIAAASVAVELKKVKGIWRHVPTIALLLFFLLTREYIHQFEW